LKFPFKIDTDKKQIKTFGIGLCVILCIFATICIFKHSYTKSIVLFSIGGVSLLISLINPIALKPVYVPCMFFAHCLGWVNTRLLLGIIYYFIFTPVSFFFKITGKDMLDQKLDLKKISYWSDRSEKVHPEPDSMEKQF
jgi:hypothetical protein